VPVLKSGTLNLLEPLGPVQACKSDCSTFTFIFCMKISRLFVVSNNAGQRCSAGIASGI